MGTRRRPTREPIIATETITRRSVVDWLGKATVLALGADFLAACAAAGGSEADGGRDGGFDAGADGSFDGGVGDSGGEGGGDGGPSGFPFDPGADGGGVYSDFRIRTVDPQDLEQILSSWRLTVDGLVSTPSTFTFADLVEMPRQDQVTDFHCVEGWSVYDVPWNGIRLSTLLDEVEPTEDATYVTFHTIGGTYNESLPMDIAREDKTLLSYGIDGFTIPLSHGFPLRLVVPRLLGYKSAKYVERIELTNQPLNGFWVAAGYPYLGEVPESRLREGKY